MLMKSQNVVLSSFLILTPLNSLFCFQYVYANNSEIEILYYSINDTVIYIHFNFTIICLLYNVLWYYHPVCRACYENEEYYFMTNCVY